MAFVLNNPNVRFPKIQNISRSFAMDREFNEAFSRYVYGLGKNGSGSLHFSHKTTIPYGDRYPTTFVTSTTFRYEVDTVFIANTPDKTHIMFYVEEFSVSDTEGAGTPLNKYVTSFVVPKGFDLDSIKYSRFQNISGEWGDEMIRLDDGFGDSTFVISKTGLNKIGEEE